MTPPTAVPPEESEKPILDVLEIQTNQSIGLPLPLGLVNGMRTEINQTLVVDTEMGSVMLVHDQDFNSELSDENMEPKIRETTVEGISILSSQSNSLRGYEADLDPSNMSEESNAFHPMFENSRVLQESQLKEKDETGILAEDSDSNLDSIISCRSDETLDNPIVEMIKRDQWITMKLDAMGGPAFYITPARKGTSSCETLETTSPLNEAFVDGDSVYEETSNETRDFTMASDDRFTVVTDASFREPDLPTIGLEDFVDNADEDRPRNKMDESDQSISGAVQADNDQLGALPSTKWVAMILRYKRENPGPNFILVTNLRI